MSRYGAYNNKRVRSWMSQVKDITGLQIAQTGEKIPPRVPVSVMIDVWLPWAKRTAKKVIAADPYALHTIKPDADNLLKPILDGITQAGLWDDDDQIATMFIEKKWCPRGEERIEVVISWKTE